LGSNSKKTHDTGLKNRKGKGPGWKRLEEAGGNGLANALTGLGTKKKKNKDGQELHMGTHRGGVPIGGKKRRRPEGGPPRGGGNREVNSS